MNSMIIEKLVAAGVLSSTGRVDKEELETYSLTYDVLVVMYDVEEDDETHSYLRAVIEKWTFQDKAMGEQFITFDYLSEKPVAWAVNDYCIFRGERFVLNYIPSVTQKGRRNKVLDAYKYEGVKLNSLADELTRCQMLDVVLTSGQHDPDEGTNYTGSSLFQLFCGAVTVNGVTRTPVMTLGDRILANLNRMYGEDVWSIVYGPNTASEDQQLSFDNQYVSEALAEVKNKFDLNYAVRGRTIYIGCDLGDIAGVDYGYGPGYPTEESGGKGLFELKKISDSSQQIVTRLRVLGSTKNLPYRYYNKAYDIPQALFPLNLQLPDTFLPEGTPDDPAGTNTKWGHNNQRSGSGLRAVKGASNDAYIDKNDDAASTPEGIREATVRFDGSDSKLKEIYPTIEGVTYDELRGSNVPDQDGHTGPEAFPNYGASERVNELLAIGKKEDDDMVDDANIGNGILSEDGVTKYGTTSNIVVPLRIDTNMTPVDDYFCGQERTLFSLTGVTQGKYFFTPVVGKEPYFFFYVDASTPVAFIIRVKQTIGSVTTTIAEYMSDFVNGVSNVILPTLPDAFFMDDAKVKEIAVSAMSDITVTFTPCTKNVRSIMYNIGDKVVGDQRSYTPQYVWSAVDNMDSSNIPFHVFVKDMGFDFAAQFNGDTPAIVMKSGECVGREFQIGQSIEKVEYQGKKGYMLTLNRASDSSLNTYYPNSKNKIAADDQFVITGIDMPDAYIKAAEMRLLTAATEWLAENGDTHFHYQPSIDDIYLKRNYDNMVKAGTPEDSVFWKLYAGYELTFDTIPDDPSQTQPVSVSVTIESISITMGEGLTRKVDITLNDELKESSLKRVTRDVKELNDKIQSGTGMSSVTMETTVRKVGDKQYLSKVNDDEAAGNITFNGTIRFSKPAVFVQGAWFGEGQGGSFGAEIDQQGNIHTQKNVEAEGGVSAHGVADLTQSQTGGGGGGDVHGVRIGNGTAIGPDAEGIVPLPPYPVTPSQSQMDAWDAKYDKPIGGIPKSDLSNGVASSLDKADSSVQPEALEPIVNSIGMAVSMARDNKEAIDELDDALSDHKNDKNNPHEVTKSQVGLGNVDNTSDLSKPVSTATQTELNKKVDKASLVSKGSAVHPIYFDNSGEAQEVTGIDVPNNVQAGGGVSAQGIADLSQAAGGGRGLVNGVRIGEGAPIGPDQDGIVPLPAYPTWNDLKPQGGITKNDLSLNVQGSLDKADSAVQPEDLPEVPDVVTFDNLNPNEAETTQKVATAKSVTILKDRIGVEELDEYDPTRDYHRGDIVKVTSGGIATGYRFKLETPVGTAMAGRVEKLTYKTLANPLNIVGIENILV